MNYTETDILYALFILKANHGHYAAFKEKNMDKGMLCAFVEYVYADLFADRAIAEESYEVGLIADTLWLLRNGKSFVVHQNGKTSFKATITIKD